MANFKKRSGRRSSRSSTLNEAEQALRRAFGGPAREPPRLGGVALVRPDGYRIEGLALDDALWLLQKLGQS